MNALFRDTIVAVLGQEHEVLQRWLAAGAVSHPPFPTRAAAGVEEVAARIVEELHEIGGVAIGPMHDRVLAERVLQAALGCDAAHDDVRIHAELTQAAICYAETAHAQVCQPTPAPPGFKHRDWPFNMADFYADPDVTENLVKAAAYLLAEAERIARQRERQQREKQSAKAHADDTSGSQEAPKNAPPPGQASPPGQTRPQEKTPPPPSSAQAQCGAQARAAAASASAASPQPSKPHVSPYVKIEPGTSELAPLIHIYLPHPDDLKPAG